MDKAIRLNAVLEMLRSSPGRIHKIFVSKEHPSSKVREVLRLTREQNIPCLFVPRPKLDSLAPGHQGIVALISLRPFVSVEDILAEAKNPFLVLLDEVEDPQNLGAIIRSAEGAGVDGLIIPSRRSAGLTEAALSVSAGAAAYVRVARVTNLARTMEDLKRRGLWLIGAEGGGKEYWYQFDYTIPVGIVLGSEGHGLRRLIREKCDKILSIPLLGHLHSLNVASAAAVFFFEVVRQRTARQKDKESEDGNRDNDRE